MTEPDQDQPDEPGGQGFTSELQADIRADVQHPDAADLTPDERRHLGLPDPDEEQK